MEDPRQNLPRRPLTIAVKTHTSQDYLNAVLRGGASQDCLKAVFFRRPHSIETVLLLRRRSILFTFPVTGTSIPNSTTMLFSLIFYITSMPAQMLHQFPLDMLLSIISIIFIIIAFESVLLPPPLPPYGPLLLPPPHPPAGPNDPFPAPFACFIR